MPGKSIGNEITQEDAGLVLRSSAVRPLNQTVDLGILTGIEEPQPDEGPDLIVELIDLYLEDAAQRLAAMEEALAKKDDRALRRAAHSLRGSSGTLGALQLAQTCEELERLECNDRGPGPQAILNFLAQEFGRVRDVLLAERQRRVQ